MRIRCRQDPRRRPGNPAKAFVAAAALLTGIGTSTGAAGSTGLPQDHAVLLRVEKPLFLNARAGSRKSGLACVIGGTLFGRDFVQVQDPEFLLRRELGGRGIDLVDPETAPREGLVSLDVSLENIRAQICSPSVGLFGGGAGTRGKVTFTFLIRQRAGLGPVQPAHVTDIVVDTQAFGPSLREDEYFPKAVQLLAAWMIEDWGWPRRADPGHS